jgi:hypothetical protein
MNKLLNEVRNLEKRLVKLLESSSNSDLKTEFDNALKFFDDYPENSIEAKKMGFDVQKHNISETRSYYVWGKKGISYGNEWGDNLLNPNLRKQEALFLNYRDSDGKVLYGFNNSGTKYGDPKTTVNIYLYDIDLYAKYGLKDIEYIRKDITKDSSGGYSDRYLVKYTKDWRDTEIDKPWFMSVDPKTLKKAEEKGFDLSPISNEEF